MELYCVLSAFFLSEYCSQDSPTLNPSVVFFPINSWVVFHCIDIPKFVYSFFYPDGHLDCFQFGVMITKVFWAFMLKYFYEHVFTFLEEKPSRIPGSYNKSMFNFTRTYETVSWSDYILESSHQQQKFQLFWSSPAIGIVNLFNLADKIGIYHCGLTYISLVTGVVKCL